MTKYEQLKEELKKEAEKMNAEFKSKAKVGDFARLGSGFGILSVVDHTKNLVFIPIVYGGQSYAPIPINEGNIPSLELLGDDFSAVAKNLQDKAKQVSKEMDEVPF
jgi:hypothetical protein